MTHDEFVGRCQNYVDAAAQLLNLQITYSASDTIGERLAAEHETPAQVINSLTPLRLFHMIHEVMAEDIRTAEEVREELGKSTRQIPLELHPEDLAINRGVPEADSPEDDRAMAMRAHPAGKGRVWSDTRER